MSTIIDGNIGSNAKNKKFSYFAEYISYLPLQSNAAPCSDDIV